VGGFMPMKWVRTHQFEEIDVKQLSIFIAALIAMTFLGACASTTGGGNWKENKRKRDKGEGMPSKFVPDADEIPAEVREIEVQIDRESVILAHEAIIHVSKNYEFDISLTGDEVTHDLDATGSKDSIAQGKATAFIRNLKLTCDKSIRVKIADFGTKPFIKISARGHCSHIILGDSKDDHEVKRANKIQIRNERVRYVGATRETAVSLKN
jgi:hypothetical protein